MNEPRLNTELRHPKVVTCHELLDRLAPLRAKGLTVVFTNGCYDILHPGHVDLLARAAALGDILVLGLNSDNSVRSLNKAPDRPVNPFESRAYVLAGLESVSFVTRFDESTPQLLIEKILPDVLVKGGDWNVDNIVGRDVVEKNNGKVVSLPLLPGYSTTALIARIRKNA